MQVLGQTSLMMLKHELTGFLDSLKSEGKLLSVSYIYEQMMIRPTLDLYYLRPKLEDMFRDGLSSNPTQYIELLELPKLFEDLSEWSATTLHNILEKCLDLNNEETLLKVLKKVVGKLSTIKVVDLLKKVMILDKKALADKILEISLTDNNHSKSTFFLTQVA